MNCINRGWKSVFWGCAVVLAGCVSSSPSDSAVLQAIQSDDFLLQHGCVQYENFQRINGIDHGTSYTVVYQVTQRQVLSQEDCMNKITQAHSGEPLAGLAAVAGLWGSLGPLVELSMRGGSRVIQAEMLMIKSEKGWIKSVS